MLRNLVLIISLIALLASDAVSQTSSGRHRAQRVEPQVDADREGATGSWRWNVTMGAGLATSGDVLRIRTAGTSGIEWAPPGGRPFSSPDVRLTLDEGLVMTVGAGRRLAPRWWARVDVGVSSIDLAAEARRGELVESILWDRCGLLTASIGLEYRLTELPSFPFLIAGIGLVGVSDDGDGQFDQTRFAWRFGAGYQQALSRAWALRFEVRDALADLDLAGYVPPVVGNQTPDFEIEESGSLHVFELTAALSGQF